jgi:hypothetical protein
MSRIRIKKSCPKIMLFQGIDHSKTVIEVIGIVIRFPFLIVIFFAFLFSVVDIFFKLFVCSEIDVHICNSIRFPYRSF